MVTPQKGEAVQYQPVLIDQTQGKQTAALQPASLETPTYNEAWLQDLIHTQPNLLPAGEVEACFENIIPVLREFTLPSGYLDNFYITPEGYPVLVEVKLWKNQEARRKVIAQILEYAKDFANLTYDAINQEIRKQLKATKWGNNPLYELVASQLPAPPDEARFVDRVTRNLREGRFLLLIVGDGIREEMASLAQYLMHHSLRYAFGMVEIRLYTLPDGSVLALPRVLARTQTIERHVTVVTMQNGDFKVASGAPLVTEKLEKTSLSTDAFYELLAKATPNGVSFVKELLSALSDLPIDVQIGSKAESLMLKASVPEGGQVTLMLVTPTNAQFWGLPNKYWTDPAWQQLSRTYLERISALLPGTVIKEFNRGMDLKLGEKFVPLPLLFGHTAELAETMRQALKDIDAYLKSNGSIT